jgi:YHS domain-containing protein
VFEEATCKLNINGICYYFSIMSKDIAFSDNLMSAIEKEVKQTRV